MNSTNPPIAVRQNSERGIRLLTAQRRLYSDAKTIHYAKMITVMVGSVLGVASALRFPNSRVTIGLMAAATLLAVGVLGGNREKRRIKEAVSVQEEFDTWVFQLSWNDLCADRPSPTLIAEASARGVSDGLKDWYPDTASIARPFDVLICQRSNMGWGSSMHRLWAALLSFSLFAILSLAAVVGWASGLSFAAVLAAIIAPVLAPVRELVEIIRANLDNAQGKASLESKILSLWTRGLNDPASVTEAECRSVQDRILTIRQTNAPIPDWLHRFRRESREKAMLIGADHMREQAIERGLG